MEYLGIDVGSSYLKIWLEDEYRDIVTSRSLHHKGSPKERLLEVLSGLGHIPEFLCYSGNLSDQDMRQWHFDGILAEVDCLKERYRQRHLLIFGAEKIELVHFDDRGRILSYQTNPACAAGTGSFLDEQIGRLGLSLEELGNIPIEDNAPLVASRCAVFAKTDLIHLQQEGHSTHAMYNGLCKGLVISGIKSVFGGNIPDGSNILLSGGLLTNPHVRHFLIKMLPLAVTVSDPMFSRAKGLCEKARLNAFKKDGFIRSLETSGGSSSSAEELMPLALKKSTFPSVEIGRKTDAFGNELWYDIRPGEFLDAYLGVDIGSTSTKAVLADTTDAIRLDIYTKTAGNPIEATRRIFRSIVSLQKDLGFFCTVRGCSTTGSGRKLIGEVIGADLIINEISAHAKGAKTVDPDVKTIFEIGGQDAKFIRLEAGRIADVNMNYVCAAGTGSFIEEQANTLGIRLDDISSMVMGVRPLPNSDRCTVFMNHEINSQLAAGYPKARIIAGVLFAVFKNYINRVVGNRYHDRETIVFQGATARNRGLVAALENITGARVMVSPFCHVMGAYGAALLAKEKDIRDTAFKGFTIPEIQIRESSCRGCENNCRITTIKTGAETVSWGHLCGMETGTNKRSGKKNPAMKIREDLLQGYMASMHAEAGHVFKIPALGLYEEFLPLLKEIARECKISIEACRFSKQEIVEELSSTGTGDFCYPVKVAMACTNILLKKYPDDKILLPFLIQDESDQSIHPRSLYCPFITALPGFYRQGKHAYRIFTPTIDLSRKVSWQACKFNESLESAGIKGIPGFKLEKAFRKGISELGRYRRNLTAAGRTLMERIPEGTRIIALLGRSYNLYHKVLNLGIPELVESLGYTLIPMDIIPDTACNADVVERFPDMYWFQGQKILRKALSIADRPDMFPLLISNFSCGPDSFILSYFEDICRHKPYLILELDEHGSATGYQTRIEAFCDMIDQYGGEKRQKKHRASLKIRYRLEDIQGDSRIWIPQIHPYIPQLWASVLQHNGFHAIAMGEETSTQCNAGRAYCRGSECLPAAVTIGKFLSCTCSAGSGSSNVLFMPRAEGPCRFGQYATLQSKILDRVGMDNAYIFSPTSENGYAFLNKKTEREVWKATCLGDMLYKLRCRSMPYHPQPGMCEVLFKRTLKELCTKLLKGEDFSDTIRLLVHKLGSSIDYSQPRKPLVGIVGEIFVRLNSFSNQHVVEEIESCGAEAWLSPLAEWVHYVLMLVSKRGALRTRLGSYIKRRYTLKVEEDILRLFSPILNDLHEPHLNEVISAAQRFLPLDFEGESVLTMGRARLFADQGAALVVNCSPFCCMPGRITSYIFQNNPEYFNVPVVNLFFDGIGDIASQVSIYLNSITLDRSHPRHRLFSSFKKRSSAPGSIDLPYKETIQESHDEIIQ